ncbi:hypothetical protein [Halomarina pelagica]|uniref:hypothetical protein n=1 Tax=Halomarina pelagica TaxID=2961599 RepID=UPI0020C2BA3E|nr:hypothetical protein [Halomarina sp. BND7]
MNDSASPPPPPEPSLFGPVVCWRAGHEWTDHPFLDAQECLRCGAMRGADGEYVAQGITPRDVVLALAVGLLVGGWLVVGFLMYYTGF